MSFITRVMSNMVQAKQFGAQAGDILIWDLDTNKPVPGERIYAPYERQAATKRAKELNDSLLPDLFGDAFD